MKNYKPSTEERRKTEEAARNVNRQRVWQVRVCLNKAHDFNYDRASGAHDE